MRIAVISDTHNHFPAKLPARLKGADEIWHLGDVSEPALLVEIEQLGAPLRIVLGNCDSYPGWPLVLELERGGLRFHLVHIPPAHAPADTQVVLHGHTHIARDETDELGVRWLNPGAISRPRRGPASFAWLTVEGGRLSWKLVAL
jgi:putative phosphoesterase